jgi:hypothetical protein
MIFPWGEGISHGSAHGLPWQCSIVRSFPKPVFSFNFGVLHDFFLRSFPPALWNSQPLSGNQGGRDANARRPGKSQRATWNVGDWVSALTYFGSLWFISVSSASISISKRDSRENRESQRLKSPRMAPGCLLLFPGNWVIGSFTRLVVDGKGKRCTCGYKIIQSHTNPGC